MTLTLSESPSTNRVLLVSGLGSLLLHGIALILLNMASLSPSTEAPPTRVQVRLISAAPESPASQASPVPQQPESQLQSVPAPPPRQVPVKPVDPPPAPSAHVEPTPPVKIPSPQQTPAPKVSSIPPVEHTRQLMKMAPATSRLPQLPSSSAPPVRTPATPALPAPTLSTTEAPTHSSALPPPPITLPHPLSGQRPSMPAATITSPTLMSSSKPVYPLLARDKGWEGISMVRALIDIEGHPTQVHIHSSSGFPALDQSAVEAVKTWTFTPAKDGNIPFAKWVNIPIKFSLRE